MTLKASDISDFQLSCVLFDLDGTLVDTAPDLVACLNQALKQHDLSAIDYQHIRPYISYGAMAMIRQAAPEINEARQQIILETMLNLYENNIAQHSRYFEGIEKTLTAIESKGLKWGVVTNKRERFTLPLMNALGLDMRAACIISGDTTAKSKPDPEPMLAACDQAQVAPQHCVYIGDACHDISAGKSAQMKTLAAVYGYLKSDDKPDEWGADGLIESPEQIMTWINETQCC